MSVPPEQVRLRFDEPVDAEFSPLEVRGRDGGRVDEDDARVDPEDARVVLVNLEELSEGAYDVEWRVASIDGHVVDGRYGFAVISAREDPLSDDTSSAESTAVEEPSGQAGRRPPAQTDARNGSTSILAYSALSLGVLAVGATAAYLLVKLLRRPRA